MTEVLNYTNEYLFMISDYGSPERHKHLTAHLVCALSGNLKCFVNGEVVECKGILLRPDIEHEIQAEGRMVVFLFAAVSKITDLIEKKYLSEKDYSVISDEVYEKIRAEYSSGEQSLDERILGALGLSAADDMTFDERVSETIFALESTESISDDMMDLLAGNACLSQSRLSHLFKENVGISLSRYMSFMKMKKAYEYVRKGNNFTDASLKAGFDSPSHMAASCKRMFGISLSVFMKSQEG